MASEVNFQLPENLTIASVQGLHEQLEALVDQQDHDKIIVQANNVQRADTAGLQLLLAFVNSTKDRQIKLDWNQPSEKFVSAAHLLGLEGALGIH
ncbi:STAS domain-containing protein [Agarilytica rhodophyticola]|uniref:STAS domain-containing protein n=1 Tax=Agarilytica rhodophyticola TaxID=1737490 RepID=UPI000B3429C3|nr:STAS domain-containing protein [Agarilytica rhodophyticola]